MNKKMTTTEQKMYDALKAAGTANGVKREDLAQLCVKPTDKENHWYASNVVDVHIKNLRLKLAGSDERVLTIRGFGYRLV